MECYGTQAAAALTRLLPPGTRIRLVRDRRLDNRDRYDRLLRYVFKGKLNVNVRLVARGDATVWFFDGDRGAYANELLRLERRARAHRLGLWKSCPGTHLDPLAAATTGPASRTAASGTARPTTKAKSKPPSGGCEPGYSPCLPVTDDLACGQIADSLKPITVTGSDPYHLDADGDGVACESG